MFGLRLFLHALGMVIRNFPMALRVSGPVIAAALISTGFVVVNGPYIDLGSEAAIAEAAQITPSQVISFVVFGLLYLVAYLWTAVGWHRYVLTEETPTTFMSHWHGRQILGYFGRGLLLGIILILVVIPLMFIGVAISVALDRQVIATAIVSGLVIWLPASLVFYRLAPILPAVALGKPLRIGEAWTATRNANGSLLTLAIVTVVATWAIQLPTGVLMQSSIVLGLVWSQLVQWLVLMVGVSILSTIYGAYVEKRELYA